MFPAEAATRMGERTAERFGHRWIVVGLVIVCLWVLSARAAEPTLCFEAELANELTFAWEVVEMAGASGGVALTAPEGGGDRSALRGGGAGTVTYRVPIPKAGTYTAWVRVRWNGHCSNSFMLRVGKKSSRPSSRVFGQWHWCPAGRHPLEAGVATLRLYNREDGVWVDQIALTPDLRWRPKGVQKATLVPGGPGTERPDPVMFLSTTSGGVEPLPPTDYRLSHKGKPSVGLARTRRCVVRSTNPTPLVVWLRNNSLRASSGKVVLSTPAPLSVKPGAEQAFRIAQGVPMRKVVFQLSPGTGMPRRVHPLFVRVHHGSGKVVGEKVWLVRPFQWLVTNCLACPEGAGVGTISTLKETTCGFPGPGVGTRWHVAPETAVTPFGLLDLRRAIADRTYVMAYAYTRVTSEKGGDAVLDIRYDDMIRVWLNGAEVFTGQRSAPSVQTRRLVPVKLKAGVNHLLVKLCQRKNYWEFRADVLGPDLAPAPVQGAVVAALLKRQGKEP